MKTLNKDLDGMQCSCHQGKKKTMNEGLAVSYNFRLALLKEDVNVNWTLKSIYIWSSEIIVCNRFKAKGFPEFYSLLTKHIFCWIHVGSRCAQICLQWCGIRLLFCFPSEFLWAGLVWVLLLKYCLSPVIVQQQWHLCKCKTINWVLVLLAAM